MTDNNEETNRTEVVGIRFRRAGRIYYFNPAGIELAVYDHAVVETSRGLEMGHVIISSTQVHANEFTKPLKPVIRKANTEDMEQAEKITQKENEAIARCTELVDRLRLPMKLISAEYDLEGNRLTIFFSAEGRIDFRELVRELSHQLKVRVELRQVGPRDEAKIIGGFGRCGRPLCCATFLSEFVPVSIKMAKEQNLPLNPMKISGVCGRLLCCLGYECEQYRAMKAKMFTEDSPVPAAAKVASVVGNNSSKKTVTAEEEDTITTEMPPGEVVTIPKETFRSNRMKTRGNETSHHRG
jgi:cell fate regulator YaaT (PSP1 superfamily)